MNKCFWLNKKIYCTFKWRGIGNTFFINRPTFFNTYVLNTNYYYNCLKVAYMYIVQEYMVLSIEEIVFNYNKNGKVIITNLKYSRPGNKNISIETLFLLNHSWIVKHIQKMNMQKLSIFTKVLIKSDFISIKMA